MIEEIKKGLYIGFGIFLSLGILFGIVYAVDFHSADEILGGTFTGDYNFNGNVNINSYDITPETTRTINLNPSMTADQIQAEIDKVGKYIPAGQTITFQFADGTYVLNHQLMFEGFYGGGSLQILGNGGESGAGTLHSTQQVILDFSGQNSNGLLIQKNNIVIFTKNLRIKIKTNSIDSVAIYSVQNGLDSNYFYNYFEGIDSTYGYGLLSTKEFGNFQNNYVSNIKYGFVCTYGKCFSSDNDDIGTQPLFGLAAFYGGTITKHGINQPTGSSANENVVPGGEIR